MTAFWEIEPLLDAYRVRTYNRRGLVVAIANLPLLPDDNERAAKTII